MVIYSLNLRISCNLPSIINGIRQGGRPAERRQIRNSVKNRPLWSVDCNQNPHNKQGRTNWKENEAFSLHSIFPNPHIYLHFLYLFHFSGIGRGHFIYHGCGETFNLASGCIVCPSDCNGGIITDNVLPLKTMANYYKVNWDRMPPVGSKVEVVIKSIYGPYPLSSTKS